jgi:hypothetical protein
MLERITFLLAVIGYAGLTTASVLSSRGPLPRALWRTSAVIIVTHVAMVWSVRYAWSFAEATRNGYAGFALFHSALALIVISVFLPESRARRLIWTSFAIVTVGALGAVFRYDVVAAYRIPIILLATFGTFGLLHAFWLKRRGLSPAA